ncbi:hypothetical protein NIES593_02515 [Hydrococcus rivularis NIES-593]|uniref:Uncharacterized protein n=1 Tax=Hydrococcus rivularis NIES-593 TaxID=1921803 RepID=A0A1U7HQY4_9CYAN|nr:hypothetical protein [Hydrococcus rivularis]OKH25977.1 hypothetical protein NIES593_02515 [Hydrococcus rivularis NIES-593]
MLTSVEGIYRHGRIELTELPNNIPDETRVIVTFLQPGEIDLKSHDIDQAQAEVLRANLATFADDWNSPEMSIYDNYDAAKTDR